MSRRFKLERDQTALLVIDIQERLCAAMSPAPLARMVNRAVALLEGARALGLPVVLTEQYPKGLGPTLPEVRAALPHGHKTVEKIRFSALMPEAVAGLGGRTQVLVAGMEAHVCVFQSARDLLENGCQPYLCADAVISRAEEDRQRAIDLCREAGAIVTTVEAALFDLLGRAGTQEFKKISAAVK